MSGCVTTRSREAEAPPPPEGPTLDGLSEAEGRLTGDQRGEVVPDNWPGGDVPLGEVSIECDIPLCETEEGRARLLGVTGLTEAQPEGRDMIVDVTRLELAVERLLKTGLLRQGGGAPRDV